MWLIWVVGGLLLLAAGTVTTLLPRLRAYDRRRRVAWSAARSAIESAAVSRDASNARVAEAEHLLARAELIAGSRGGPAAARTATGYATRADRLWRERRDG